MLCDLVQCPQSLSPVICMKEAETLSKWRRSEMAGTVGGTVTPRTIWPLVPAPLLFKHAAGFGLQGIICVCEATFSSALRLAA
jgi:hypothetical protein